MNKIVILPANNDLNRGDQALIWQTIEVAKRSGLDGEFYMLAEKESLTKQSQSIGIKVLNPILKHPGRKFKTNKNNSYNISLLLKWGSVALFDLIGSLLVFPKVTRSILYPFLSKKSKQTLKTIKDSNACFVKGGGFIHSSGKLTDSYTIYYLLFHILLAQSYKKPIYVMPNSFGPFQGFRVEWLVRKVLNRCELVTVRESISQEMLSEIGVESDLYPDLGFSLDKNERSNVELVELRKLYPNKELVAITARPYRFPGSTDPKTKYESYINNMVLFSKWLFENNYLPVFVDHTLSETTHESDKSCILEITSKLKHDEYSLIENKDYTSRDLKAIYSEFDYVVGTRFHSVIFALSEGVPSIAITYGGNKGQGIMKDLGLSDYAISMSEFDTDRAIQSFIKLSENKENIRLQLQNDRQIINQKHGELAERLKEKEV
jgi:colanic acid/amylovoran biosynthesis protein